MKAGFKRQGAEKYIETVVDLNFFLKPRNRNYIERKRAAWITWRKIMQNVKNRDKIRCFRAVTFLEAGRRLESLQQMQQDAIGRTKSGKNRKQKGQSRRCILSTHVHSAYWESSTKVHISDTNRILCVFTVIRKKHWLPSPVRWWCSCAGEKIMLP